MIRSTLQECIDLYNSNDMYRPAAIRGMEELGEWETAAKYWDKHASNQLPEYREHFSIQAVACQMIAESNAKGDAYRADTKHLRDWVDQTVEAGIMEKDEAISKIYPEMSKIYDSHYSRK